ncbi:DUF2252 domain-containing protein [Nakamurella sp. GG22]
MAVRTIAHPTVADRRAKGADARIATPPELHADWVPADDRFDPVKLICDQDVAREPDLVPVRHGRMMVSPFTFYRGAARIMAADLADTPNAGLDCQLCGDAHLSNFGGFASPERRLVFDLNDFDETLPGPFEWDVKRMAASFTIAARNNGLSAAEGRAATVTAVRVYREAMAEFAGMGVMDLWYAHMSEDDLTAALTNVAAEVTSVKSAKKNGAAKTAKKDSKAKAKDAKTAKADAKKAKNAKSAKNAKPAMGKAAKDSKRKPEKAAAPKPAVVRGDPALEALTALTQADELRALETTQKALRKAHTRDSLQALSKLGELVDGRYRIISQPPLVVPIRDWGAIYGVPDSDLEVAVRALFREYRASLPDDRRHLLEKFEVVDVARKVVGVGSVGTRCYIVLLQGRDAQDPLFLQVKEATRSVLEDHLPKSRFRNPGERVVQGQRMIQATSDIYVGWSKGLQADRNYYWRQLRDMKASADIENMSAFALTFYARLCGWTLARAHARSGDAVAISEYLGTDAVFEEAIADFSEKYAEQNEKDFEAFTDAVSSGRIEAVHGV